MRGLILVLVILCFTSQSQAQTRSWSSEYRKSLHEASVRRRAEILRRNNAQQEAIDMLFGPRGLPALTRPSDPWNAYGGYGMGGRGYGNSSFRAPYFPSPRNYGGYYIR